MLLLSYFIRHSSRHSKPPTRGFGTSLEVCCYGINLLEPELHCKVEPIRAQYLDGPMRVEHSGIWTHLSSML